VVETLAGMVTDWTAIPVPSTDAKPETVRATEFELEKFTPPQLAVAAVLASRMEPFGA
jgi:hypothetical protein